MSLKRPAGAVADTLRDPLNGLRRAVIDRVLPQVDCGRFAIKRCVGDTLEVMADAFVDGHEVPRVRLMHRRRAAPAWEETEMTALGNDRWRGSFTLHELGGYEYTVIAWPDSWLSWKHDFERRVDAADIEIALAVAAELIDQAAGRAPADDAKRLRAIATKLASEAAPKHRHDIVLGAELQQLMLKYPAREAATLYGTVLPVIVDPPYARFSAWYELFPRSVCGDGTHGRLADVEAILPQIAELGFDVLYLPPIHPIGITKRKGKNNALKAKPDDCGSPWAIGSIEGGHKSVHPELGTPDDVARLARAARLHGIELALDIAFQCSPDHPYAREHPQWFKHRPDGSVQFAENPPKRDQDIYPFNFDSQDWQALWHELKACSSSGLSAECTCSESKSAHQAVRDVGADDRPAEGRPPAAGVPIRGVHAAEGDAPAGEARLHAVVHVLRMAQYQDRADRILHRANEGPVARVLPPECLAQHSRYPDRSPAARRARCVHDKARAGNDAVC